MFVLPDLLLTVPRSAGSDFSASLSESEKVRNVRTVRQYIPFSPTERHQHTALTCADFVQLQLTLDYPLGQEEPPPGSSWRRHQEVVHCLVETDVHVPGPGLRGGVKPLGEEMMLKVRNNTLDLLP